MRADVKVSVKAELHTPNIQNSHISTQTFSVATAVEEQTAGNVGGFNKKWVSLCFHNQLRFLFLC